MTTCLKQRIGRALRRVHGRAALSIGRIRKPSPLSTEWGFDRGTPIDRYYIEDFLADHSEDVRGSVLEVGDDAYSRRFGGARITSQDVLHVRPGNPLATIVGDLARPGVLPEERFDCVILLQTLHLIFDMETALTQLWRSLRPGGVLLMTVPGITPIDRGEWKDSWFWSLTETAARRLLCGPFDAAGVSTRSYGNLFSATAFLHGAALQDVNPAKLDRADPAYPVIVAARAVR